MAAKLRLNPAPLLMAGEQYLTFDNATGLLAKVNKVGNRKMVVADSKPLWSFELEFLARSGFWQDLAATSIGATALTSGSATTFNVTYAGSVWSDILTWTLTIPNTNAAPISSFALSNTMSGQTITITFPTALAASTAHTIVIDCQAWTVTRSQNGATYDFTGSFPLLYGPAGQVNAMSATLTPASGTATGCTISGSVTPRWIL